MIDFMKVTPLDTAPPSCFSFPYNLPVFKAAVTTGELIEIGVKRVLAFSSVLDVLQI
jgi:hypothetical protein